MISHRLSAMGSLPNACSSMNRRVIRSRSSIAWRLARASRRPAVYFANPRQRGRLLSLRTSEEWSAQFSTLERGPAANDFQAICLPHRGSVPSNVDAKTCCYRGGMADRTRVPTFPLRARVRAREDAYAVIRA